MSLSKHTARQVPPTVNRLMPRLTQTALDTAKRAHAAYLALNPGHRLDDLYRPLLAKLARELEAQCRAKGIDPDLLTSPGQRPKEQPPAHIRKKKSPTYDEM